MYFFIIAKLRKNKKCLQKVAYMKLQTVIVHPLNFPSGGEKKTYISKPHNSQ